MHDRRARAALIRRLRLEHASERGAALAYRGHAASVRDPDERAAIARIEQEEWHHRAALGAMLGELGGTTSAWREALFRTFGATLGALCHVTGRLAPMLGACLLERLNTVGYAHMADLAERAGVGHLAGPLRAMGDTESEHEAWFRTRVVAHPLGRRLPLGRPAPRRIGGRAA